MTASVRGISAGSRGGSIDRQSQREYSITYLVSTDDRGDGPQTVRTAFGIPSIGDVYQPGNDYDARAIVTSKSVTQRESPWEWEVEVTYSTEAGEKPEATASPLDEPADISYGFQARKILVPGYFNSPENVSEGSDLELGIVSTNGELFDPQPEIDWNEPVLTIKRNVQSISAPLLMALANCVNASPFYGAGSRTLKMNPPQAQRQYDQTVGYYWSVTYAMAFKYDTWDLQLLNQGTYHLESSKPTPFKDKEGNRFVGLLTTAGLALNSSSDDTKGRYIASGEAPTFTRLRVFREIDFNSLGIF